MDLVVTFAPALKGKFIEIAAGCLIKNLKKDLRDLGKEIIFALRKRLGI